MLFMLSLSDFHHAKGPVTVVVVGRGEGQLGLLSFFFFFFSFTRNTGEHRCQLERGCAQGHICMVCHLGLLILAANYRGHRPDDIVHVIIYTAFLSPRQQCKIETTQFIHDYIHVLKFLLCVLWTFLVFTSRSYNNWMFKRVGEWRYTIGAAWQVGR